MLRTSGRRRDPEPDHLSAQGILVDAELAGSGHLLAVLVAERLQDGGLFDVPQGLAVRAGNGSGGRLQLPRKVLKLG